MQTIFQSAKRLISMCLVTLLVVTSTLTISPASAKADNVTIIHCESDCGSTISNMAAFTAGVLSGSAVTVAATGSAGTIATGVMGGIAALGHTAAVAVVTPLAGLAAPALVAAAPVVIPVAATAALGYGAYRLLEANHNSQASDLR